MKHSFTTLTEMLKKRFGLSTTYESLDKEQEFGEKFFYNPYKKKLEPSIQAMLEANFIQLRDAISKLGFSTKQMSEAIRRSQNAMQYMGRSSRKTL